MDQKYEEYLQKISPVLDPTGTRTAKLSLTPFIFDRALWAEMETISSAYANLLEFVFQKFPTNEKIQEVLEYPPDLENYLSSLNIYPRNLAAARIDIFLTEDGLRMVESNAEIPGGNEESYFLEKSWFDVLGDGGLDRVDRMDIVYNMLIKYYRTQAEFFGLPVKDHPTIYLTQWQSEIDRIRGEYDVLMSIIRERGHTCDVVDPNSIVIRDNKAYSADGEQIDLIYRRFTADELPKFADKSWQMAIDWDKADVAVVNPFCTKRVDSKNIMVLFKDEQYDDVFPEELKSDLALVRSIIPWTKKIKQSLVLKDGREVEARPYLIGEKDHLVIKHANAYSSAAVYIGDDMEPDKWEELVDESLTGDWVVQERLKLPKIDIDYWEDGQVKTANCYYNISPYLYDGKLGGFLGRASTDKLTSFKSGEIAAIMPCFGKRE
jgi:hypothetical protein